MSPSAKSRNKSRHQSARVKAYVLPKKRRLNFSGLHDDKLPNRELLLDLIELLKIRRNKVVMTLCLLRDLVS
jgi:hypothetical protein